MNQKQDEILVLSIADVSKTYLPKEHTPKQILDHYKNECIGRFPHDRFQVVVVEKHIDVDIKDQIKAQSLRHGGDYIVMGGHGRKGDQSHPYRVGKTALYITENSKVPLIMVKELFIREKNPTGGFNFLMAIDGSNLSRKIVKCAKDLARGQFDKIYLIHVFEDYTAKEATEKKLKKICAKVKCPVEEYFMIDVHEREKKDEPIEEIITRFSNESEKPEFDFILLGGTGHGAQKTERYFKGKVITHILEKSALNPVIIPG